PALGAKSTTVELSELTTLSFASRISAVSVRWAPPARLAVDDVMTSFVAEPATIVKVVVPEVSPLADAVIVIEPAVPPVTPSDAMPAAAVALPSPVTDPEPDVFANVTEVELSELTTSSRAPRISAVSVRDAPDVRSAVDDVTTSFAAGPATTLNVAVSEVRPVALPVIVIEPTDAPVTVFDAMPFTAVAVPSPVTGPEPARLAN